MKDDFYTWLFSYSSVNSYRKLTLLQSKYLKETTKTIFIHVTGTNGKGSVARYCHQALTNLTNKKVGLFTSPHIIDINERIIVNNKMISDEDFWRLKTLIEVDVKKYQLGFFAILTLMALIYFQEQNVDYAVVEVGIGGLNDATNIIKSDYAVFTSVAKDHCEVLGNTLLKITKQKMGIVKNTTKAIFISGHIKKYLQWYIRSNFKQPIYISTRTNSHNYIAQNQDLAFLVLSHLLPKCSKNVIVDSFQSAVNQLRFQIIKINKKTILLDAAHNFAGISALKKLLQTKNIKIDQIIFSSLKKKNPDQLVKHLLKVSKDITICANNHFDSIKGEKFKLKEMILQKPQNVVILITGSCYFTAEVFQALTEYQKWKVKDNVFNN